MTNKHIHERGAVHVLAIAVFVLLVGIVGFVGYNAWQKQQTNAAGSWSVGNTGPTYNAARPSTYKYGANNLCRMYHNLSMKLAVAKDQKTVVELVSGKSTILSVDSAKEKQGTTYATSSSYQGDFQTASVTYVVKTPTTKTVTEKDKKGKKKQATKTTWSQTSSAVLVRDLPRCVPTDDVTEFNFYGGGADGTTNACFVNGEIVFRWYTSAKTPSSGKMIADIDGKTVKSISTSGNKPDQLYYNRIPLKGKQFTLYYTDNVKYKGKKSVIVKRETGSLRSCL